jgi:hypothetical protein
MQNSEDFFLPYSYILIIVVLIGLVIIFKKQLNDLVKKVFQKINSDSGSIISSAFMRKC